MVENINNLQIETIYPKSNNHKIIWNKKNKINICELNQNCMEISFDLTKYQNYKKINSFENINPNNYLLYSSILFIIILLILFISFK